MSLDSKLCITRIMKGNAKNYFNRYNELKMEQRKINIRTIIEIFKCEKCMRHIEKRNVKRWSKRLLDKLH